MTTCPELRYGCRISQGTAWIYVWVTSASSHPPVPKWLLLRYDGGGEVPGITEALTPFHWGLPPTTGRRWQQILWPLWFSSQSKLRAGRVVPVSIFLGCPDCPCFFLPRGPSLTASVPSSVSQAHTYDAFLKSCLPPATPAQTPS